MFVLLLSSVMMGVSVLALSDVMMVVSVVPQSVVDCRVCVFPLYYGASNFSVGALDLIFSYFQTKTHQWYLLSN